ncbi:TonB-dependent receptor, partial [Myxococcota bacterium]|nr:TonB-dependent receptor [Myxococcota bacterium]
SIEELDARADPNLIQADTPPGEAPKPEYGGIEEITVTAKKRSTNLQETPTAITALTGAQLFDRGIYDVEQLATQVPNFQYGETFGIARITIRGVGNQGFTDPSTAFHIDGIYQNNPTAASSLTFYDLNNVEVLRGPQGTLWGRNSTAGAINVSTRRPIYEFETFGDMLFGSYNQYSGRGVVNVPLLEDRISSRVAVYFDKRDGFQENLFFPGTEQNADDADNWGIRPQLLFDLTDDAVLVLRGMYNHQGGVGFGNKILGDYPSTYLLTSTRSPPGGPPCEQLPQGCAFLWIDPYRSTLVATGDEMQPNPTNPRQIRRDTRQFQDISTWDINGTLEWDFTAPGVGDLFFSAVGSYREESRRQNFDGDLTEQDMLQANLEARTRDGVLDMHLRSANDSSTEWLLGFFMLNADGYLNTDLPGPYDGPGSPVLTLFQGSGGGLCFDSVDYCGTPLAIVPVTEIRNAVVFGSNQTLSLAGYGNLQQKFFEEQVQVAVGIRYSYDKLTAVREQNRVGFAATVQPPFPAIPPGCLQAEDKIEKSKSYSAITGDLKVDYMPVDEHMVYGSIAKGYKPGYINANLYPLNCTVVDNPNPFANRESIWAFEVGSKNRFFDNTLQANVTGFYYIYDNFQVQTSAQDTTFIQNADSARIWGFEFEGIWMPIDDLSLSVVYGYLNARYVNYVGWNFATGQIEDFSGNNMIRAPENQATLAAEYLLGIGRFGNLIPRIQYVISDGIYFTAANTPEESEPWFGNLQVRMRWENLENTLFVEGFVENATGQNVRNNRSVGSALLGTPIYASFQPPRTWGIRIGASY